MIEPAAAGEAVPILAFRKLTTFFDEAEQAGVDIETLLRAAGIDPRVLDRPAATSFDLFGRMMSLLAKRTPPEFAIRMGMRWDFTKFGLIGYSLLSSRDFGHFADRCFTQIQRFAHMEVHSRVDDKHWIIDYGVRPPMSPLAVRMCIEEACGAAAAIWGRLTGEHFSLLSMELTHADPARDALMADLLDIPVMSGCAGNRMVLRRVDRSLPIAISESDVLQLCARSCGGILTDLIDTPFPLGRLRELMLLSFGRPPHLEDTAVALGLSKRTLNRMLERRGEAYRAICRRYRSDYSMELLRSRELCVKEIAFALGFSSAASFRRTFHQWTGGTVGDWTRRETGFLPPRT